MKLTDYIKQLNSDVNNVANCEKAKKLRKNLLVGGGISLGVGLVCVLIGFILFVTGSFSAGFGFPVQIVIAMVIFILGGIGSSIGGVLIKIGLSVVIVGVSSKYLDKTFTRKCECGSVIKDEELFCSSCGKSVRPVCPNCKAEQEVGAKFCRKCGTKLDK